MQAVGTISELILVDGLQSARIASPSSAIPGPGQYLLAHEDGSTAPLAAVIFSAESRADRFICVPPVPATWRPGARVHLRGPLGRGFRLPSAAKRVALVASDGGPRRLLALFDAAARQGASVTLVGEPAPDELPFELEVQPMQALADVLAWADYAAFDVSRESLPELQEGRRRAHKLGSANAQALVRTPMPCGALAQCGVCTVRMRQGTRLACQNGPVFDLASLHLES